MSKSRFDWHLISQFLVFLKPYRKQVTWGVLAVPVSMASSVLFPWLIMHIVDTAIAAGDISGLYLWVGLLFAVLVVNYLSDASFNFFLQNAALRALRDMRLVMFKRVLRFSRSYFDTRPVGVTLTRLTSDLEAVSESFAQGLLGMVRDVLTTVALLVFLFVINWQLAMVVLVLAPPTYWITEFLRKRLREAYANGRKVLAEGTGYLQEGLNGMKTVQLYSAEEDVQARYRQYTLGFYQSQSRSNFYDSSLFSIIEGLTTVAMALIIWVGSGLILEASITFGVLIGFTQTLDRIFVPVRDFTSQIASIQRALAALGNIEEVFKQPLQFPMDELPSDQAPLNNFESLVFDNVSFRYTDDGPWVLNGVSFTLQRGQQIALVGATGSGKSTIIRLLTKTYENYSGSIKINGRELRDISLPELAHVFALMQQDVYLFTGSVAFNIGLDRPGVDDRAVEDAARYVYADGFIDQLPGKYDFVIENNGGNLSAGQGQLIAFARAMATGCVVVLLDEATASVDSKTEKLIQRAVDHVFSEKTVIAIAHRLSTIKHSDQILVLDSGVIVEQGTHNALIEQRGRYAQLLQDMDA